MENRSGGETNVYYSTEPNKYKELCFCKVKNYNLGHKGIQFCFQIPDAYGSTGLEDDQLNHFVNELSELYRNNTTLKLFKQTVNSFELNSGGRLRFSIVELFNPTSYLSNNKEDSVRGAAAQTFFNRFIEKTVNLQQLGYKNGVGNKNILYIDLLNNNSEPQDGAPEVEQSVAEVADEQGV